MGKLWVGYNELDWLGECILKAVEPKLKSDFFKHHRDGYKAIHVIRRSNQHGNFLEIFEFRSVSRQGVIHIPEGMQRHGWVAFAKFCKDRRGHSTEVTHLNFHRNRAMHGGLGLNKCEEGSQLKITHKDRHLKNNASIAVKNALVKTDKEGSQVPSWYDGSFTLGVNAHVGLVVNKEPNGMF